MSLSFKKKERRLAKHGLFPEPSPRLLQPTSANKANLWRVIAPFVTVPKKVVEKEAEQFSFYLKKRPEVLLKDLSSFISDSVDLPSLFHETSDVLKKVTKASWVALYLVDRMTNEIYLSKPHHIKERHKVRWSIDEQALVATYVALKKEYVLIEDVLYDKRFQDGIAYNNDMNAKSVMCIPLVTPDGDCFAVLEFVKTIGKDPFSQDDLRICVMVTAWMGVAIHQNQERLALKRQQELNDYLLDLVKCYFEDHVLMEKLMSEVVKFAKITLGAERGSFFIIDKESEEMIAHLFDEACELEGGKAKKVRFSKERGIAGLVARTGITVNIKDAYKDSRFNKEIDQKTGFITRSILCMPILGRSGTLGVVQVVNKINGGCFTSADETLFKTFSLYCSLALHYTNVHTETNKEKHLNLLNWRIIQLQQRPCIHDAKFFSENRHVEIPKEFDSFRWYIKNNEELGVAPQYTLYIMFQLIDIKEINVRNMMNFILTVRKFYRPVSYHNFEHAFNVCHCMYAILKRNLRRFTKLEVKALLVATICHDLDHGGFTNTFLQLVKDDLAMLYESSILENHHYQMTLRLLGEYEIFYNITETSRRIFHNEIQKAIIATDLALYFEKRKDMTRLLENNLFNWTNLQHRDIVKGIMMNACDLSGSCKPFLAARRITDNLYKEFYHEGDLEKELGVCPLSVMDRDKEQFIPDDQIRFLNIIVLPCCEILRKVWPNTKELYMGGILLRSTWQDIIDTRGKRIWRQDDSIAVGHL